jgi:MSHA biogenesis protein MshN
MSVVNKMLQDLETRKQHAKPSADYVPKTVSNVKSQRLGVSLSLIAAVIALGYGAWTISFPQHTEVLASSSNPQVFPDKGPVMKVGEQSALNPAPSQSGLREEVESNVVLRNVQPTVQVLSDAIAVKQSPEADSTTLREAPKSQAIPKSVNDVIKRTTSQNDTPLESQAEIAHFSVAPSNGSKARISSLREQARIALNENNIAQASLALEKIVAEYPNDVRTRKQLASLLFSHNSIERAQYILTQGLVINPGDNSMRIMMARLAFKTGDYKGAHATLAQHPYPELADIELVSFRAALAERLSQYIDAHKDYKILITREPQNAKWWLGLGVSQDKLKRPQQALASYQYAKDLKQLPSQVDDFVKQRIAVLERES